MALYVKMLASHTFQQGILVSRYSPIYLWHGWTKTLHLRSAVI